MRFLALLLTALLVSLNVYGQKSIEETLEKFNDNSVDYITVEELPNTGEAILLDTRKFEEYKVSHLNNAYWIGHKKFKLDSVLKLVPDKDSEVIVYCSIGVRSENIGEKLKKAGYSNVKNLYGGIFLWKNKGYPVFDQNGKETEKIHAFSKQWGKLLTKGEKIYNTKSTKIEEKPQ